MTNRLAGETSPYLLQHKDNPVDWYPWGPEALDRARAEDRPIFLSIGYSACHWCHVMERESFEDPDIAAVMNREFVCIKVDREERPDLDAIYMAAVQAMTGQGGWPMSVFLTPDGRPFYGGTYFPPDDRGGRPGFRRVLETLADIYRTRRGDVATSAQQLVDHIRSYTASRRGAEPLAGDALTEAFSGLAPSFDAEDGGFGAAPKFPQPLILEFLLRYWHSTGSADAFAMVDLTLEKMARGGMYDQLGGGFHRYSTDRRWLVPHFEKMLYDNALLAPVYLHAWQVTGKPMYRRIVEETLAYVLREMTGPEGGFYSAQDADSEGEEGKFFVWRPEEIDAVVGGEAGRAARVYYGVIGTGNFEGKNILHVSRAESEVAAEIGIPVEMLEALLAEARPRLLAARDLRVRPGLDDKVIVAWNGLMLKALAECGAALDKPEWLDAARHNAEFLLRELFAGDRLLRTWRRGRAGSPKGYLEDYACLAAGLVALYEATFEQRWLTEAERLADGMIDLFWEQADEAFFDAGRDGEALVVRPHDIFDNATPCGGSAAAAVLLRLAALTGREDYGRRAEGSLRSVGELLRRAPSGFANWLNALDFHLAAPQEVVLIGPKEHPGSKALAAVIYGSYAPNRVVAGAGGPQETPSTPLLEGRGLVEGRPAAYVCENYVCALPVTEPEALERQLAAISDNR